jgi:nitroreductase
MTLSGIRPWSPLNDRAEEEAAMARADELRSEAAASGGGFAEHLDDVPVLLAVFVDLGALAAVDRDADRYPFAGGASVYPFVWNLLLAARAEGLGGVMTTMPIRREEAVKDLLGAPSHTALATVVALGRPVHQPTRLTREPVESFTSVDRYDGPPLPMPRP